MTWRDHIKVHPAADLFPLMSDAGLQELTDDIKESGGLTRRSALPWCESEFRAAGRWGRRRTDWVPTFSAARIPDPAMMPVFVDGRCAGHLFHRGRAGVEAFDRDERSLGIYPNQREAAAALSKATKGGVP
jgi:hypothetical protein